MLKPAGDHQSRLPGDVERHPRLAPIIGGKSRVVVDAADGIHAGGGNRRVDVRERPCHLVTELKAPAYRLEIIDRAQPCAGEEPFARPCAVILRPFL